MQINAETKKFGIIGYPLSHTYSPLIHNAAFQASGYNGIYLVFPIKNLIQLKFSMRQMSISGLSVTIPHKIGVKRFLDAMDPLAIQIGSVNTIVMEKNIYKGYNTDALGAIEALKNAGIALQNKKILVVGSGGSARSIVFGLYREKPSKITILARNKMKAKKIIHNLSDLIVDTDLEIMHMKGVFSDESSNQNFKIRERKNYRGILYSTLNHPEQIHCFDIIIQTTPMGMKNHPLENDSIFSSEYIKSNQVLFDIVYNPSYTPLVKLARRKKLEIVYGYKMLLFQAAAQYELFTRQKAPIDVMEKALLKELKRNA